AVPERLLPFVARQSQHQNCQHHRVVGAQQSLERHEQRHRQEVVRVDHDLLVCPVTREGSRLWALGSRHRRVLPEPKAQNPEPTGVNVKARRLTRIVSMAILESAQLRTTVALGNLYFISVAARMLGMHPQTLRKYERLGLVQPTRTVGSMRLYSP